MLPPPDLAPLPLRFNWPERSFSAIPRHPGSNGFTLNFQAAI